MEVFILYLVFGLVSVALILLVYTKWVLSYWKRRNVPYLEPSFPFGNLESPTTNKKSQGVHYKEFYDKFKNSGVKCGGIYEYISPTLIPIDPEINKHILVKDFEYFHARGFYYNEKHQPVSANLFTIDGKKWRTLRVKFTPTFTSSKMKFMFDLMLAAGKTMDAYLQEYADTKTPLNVKDCVGRMTTNVIGSCAFGLDCNSFKDVTVYKLLTNMIEGFSGFIKVTFCNSLPKVAQLLGLRLLPDRETNIICKSIEETISYRTEKNVSRNDFLQLLMEMKDKEMVDMTELKGQCISFFLAGYETSAITMTFALFELAKNQDVQEKLRKEINEVLREHNNEITYEAVMNMKYLYMVINETLRMYPPLPFLNRICVNDYRLPNSDIVIENGTKIIFPIQGLHYDPEYFPEPYQFNPERFSAENKAQIPPYTFMPFGDGPRNCIGDRFAKQQIRVGLACVIRKYRFRLNPKVKVPLEFDTTTFIRAKDDILLDVEAV